MDKILEKFSFYDFIGYFLPGSLILLFVDNILVGRDMLPMSGVGNNEILFSIYFVIVSYAVGFISHEFSEIVQKYVLRLIWKGMPSEKLLMDEDKTYTEEYKERIRKKIVDDYGLSISKNKKANQEIFNLVYSKVQKSSGKEKIQTFNSLYGFTRNFLGSIILCVLMQVTFRLLDGNAILWTKDNIVVITITLCIIFLLLRRVKRFAIRFVDYVYREYLNLN